MKRVFANHSEVCHKWASQSQEDGCAGNITFDGRTIHSYGHWPMASFDADDPKVVLYRDASYSVSTACHQQLTLDTVSHCKIFHVVSGYSGGRIDHKLNIANYQSNMRVAADKFWNAHRPCYNDCGYQTIVQEARDYARHYKVKLSPLFGLELSGKLAEKKRAGQKHRQDVIDEANRVQRECRGAAELKAKPQLDRLQAEFEAKWLAGEGSSYDYHGQEAVKVDGFTFYASYNCSQTRLRLTKDETQVETSQGARVDVKAAELLYKLMQSGKPVHGHKIDGYTVTSYNGALKIGCHEIQQNEIDRFAKVMNWTK